MIKDLFVAIVLGALLGIAATGGFFTYKNSKSNKAATVTPTPIISAAPSQDPQEPEDSSQSNISIISPTNESVVINSKTTIEGITKPNSIVIIKNAIDTINTVADSVGKFEAPINLESGINQVLISAFDEEDNQYDTQLLITYSTAKF